MTPIRKILAGLGVCLVTCALSVISYHQAGWEWVDSVYMVIITIFGVGYGEVHPIDQDMLKIQTMALIVIGGFSGLYSIGGFLQLVTEGEIKRAFGEHHMTRGIRKLRQHTIICGYGRVGQMLSKELLQQKQAFVIVDTCTERLRQAEAAGAYIVEGDAISDEVLMEAGIEHAKYLACVLPNDASNVFITLSARELAPEVEIIARAESPSTESKLRRSGANHVVMPAAIGAVRMAQILTETTPQAAPAAARQRLRTVPVSSCENLESATLETARGLVSELGDIVGIQRSDRGIITDLDSQITLGPEDILLLSDHAK